MFINSRTKKLDIFVSWRGIESFLFVTHAGDARLFKSVLHKNISCSQIPFQNFDP